MKKKRDKPSFDVMLERLRYSWCGNVYLIASASKVSGKYVSTWICRNYTDEGLGGNQAFEGRTPLLAIVEAYRSIEELYVEDK